MDSSLDAAGGITGTEDYERDPVNQARLHLQQIVWSATRIEEDL